MQRCVFACAFVVGVAHSGPDRQVEDHYRSFETQTFANTSYSQLRRLLLRGVPFVVSDGARGLPMGLRALCDLILPLPSPAWVCTVLHLNATPPTVHCPLKL